MTLAVQQQAFLSALASSEDALPHGLPDEFAHRFSIYRNAYRVTLVDALTETFPRTFAYAGKAPFQAAAAHHLIANPPKSWTLDRAGDGFAGTLAALFANDPEIAEIASLEWAMHIIFVARDCAPLGVAGFAARTAAFGEDDWNGLRFECVPALQAFEAQFDLARWWADPDSAPVKLGEACACVVWREEERPVFLIVSAIEAEALALAGDGISFGALCECIADRIGAEAAIAACGNWLGLWLARGWIAGVRRS